MAVDLTDPEIKTHDVVFHKAALNPNGSIGAITIIGTNPYLTRDQARALAQQILLMYPETSDHDAEVPHG